VFNVGASGNPSHDRSDGAVRTTNTAAETKKAAEPLSCSLLLLTARATEE